MSGIGSDALNDLCSDKSADERIVHFNSILKFAILRKDRAFLAIGGPMNAAVDGGNPSVDDPSLIQTAIRCLLFTLTNSMLFLWFYGYFFSLKLKVILFSDRYVKDLTQADLHDCQHWNRFLEVYFVPYLFREHAFTSYDTIVGLCHDSCR